MSARSSLLVLLWLAASGGMTSACLLDTSGRAPPGGGGAAGSATSTSTDGGAAAGGSTASAAGGAAGAGGGTAGSPPAEGPVGADVCPGEPVLIEAGISLISTGDTTGAQDDTGSPVCGGGASPDLVHALSIGSTGLLTATLDPQAPFKGFVYIRSACEDPQSELGCGEGPVTVPVQKGDAAYVFVDGHMPRGSGAYTLRLSLDTCGNSIVDGAEECDDGNLQDGDGCTSDCKVSCTTDGSATVNAELFLDPATHHCYLLALDPNRSWDTARTDCQQWGGDLAVLAAQAEIDALSDLLSKSAEDTWIGGNDLVTEGEFTWVNGEPWVYAGGDPPWNFNPGGSEPNGGTSENCVEIQSNGHLNDEDCPTAGNYLCERAPAGK